MPPCLPLLVKHARDSRVYLAVSGLLRRANQTSLLNRLPARLWSAETAAYSYLPISRDTQLNVEYRYRVLLTSKFLEAENECWK